MNAAQISRARAVAEESEDGQLIRDLCDELELAWAEGHESGFWNGRKSAGHDATGLVGKVHGDAFNPYRNAA